jgi:hypothetical protein
MKLDGLGDIIAAQLGGETQGAFDPGRDASGKDPGIVDDHPFVDGNRAEGRQQMKRRPVDRRSTSFK